MNIIRFQRETSQACTNLARKFYLALKAEGIWKGHFLVANMDASAWRQEKVRSKKEVILEAQRDKKKVHQDYLTVMGQAADAIPDSGKNGGRVFPKHKWPKSWEYIEDRVPLERNLYGPPTRWTIVGKTVRGSSVGAWMGRVPNWECLFVHREKGLFLSVYVDHIKKSGKKQNMALMWKKLMKNVDIDKPISFL